MSLGRINDRLEENRVAIGLVEAAIAKDPAESASLRLLIKPLEKMKEKLKAEWLDVASQSRGVGGGQSKFSSFSVNRMRALNSFIREIRERITAGGPFL